MNIDKKLLKMNQLGFICFIWFIFYFSIMLVIKKNMKSKNRSSYATENYRPMQTTLCGWGNTECQAKWHHWAHWAASELCQCACEPELECYVQGRTSTKEHFSVPLAKMRCVLVQSTVMPLESAKKKSIRFNKWLR